MIRRLVPQLSKRAQKDIAAVYRDGAREDPIAAKRLLDLIDDKFMTIDLKGRIALVTGASRGIGYFTALELARAGAHVIAVARTVGGLEELDDEIQKSGGSATLVPMDLTDMKAIDALGGAIFERWGKLDILVANAGVLGVISPVGHALRPRPHRSEAFGTVSFEP